MYVHCALCILTLQNKKKRVFYETEKNVCILFVQYTIMSMTMSYAIIHVHRMYSVFYFIVILFFSFYLHKLAALIYVNYDTFIKQK